MEAVFWKIDGKKAWVQKNTLLMACHEVVGLLDGKNVVATIYNHKTKMTEKRMPTTMEEANLLNKILSNEGPPESKPGQPHTLVSVLSMVELDCVFNSWESPTDWLVRRHSAARYLIFVITLMNFSLLFIFMADAFLQYVGYAGNVTEVVTDAVEGIEEPVSEL
jgi:hypothetical protein